MIDPHVELIAIDVISVSDIGIEAIQGTSKSNACRVQAVANRVVVRQRHSCKQCVLDKARRIISRPVWIAHCSIALREHAELLEISGRTRRFDWIAVAVDCRIVLGDVLAIRSWEKTENTLPSQRCKYGTYGRLLEDVALFVDQSEEK